MDTPATNASKIVEELLDNDAAKEYALSLNLDTSGITPEQLAVFKRQATGYIKWIMESDWSPNIARDIQKAATFTDVVYILSLYDDPAASFISMVSQGYF